MAPLLYEMHKLVLFKDKCRAMSVCLFSIAIVGGLKSLIILSHKVPLSNKVYIIYKAKSQCATVKALKKNFKSFNIKKRNKIGDREELWGMPVCI